MSVINKMLQDLDARESDSQRLHADYQPPIKNSPRIVWFMLGGILLLACAIGLYILMYQSSLSAVSQPHTNLSSPAGIKQTPAIHSQVNTAQENQLAIQALPATAVTSDKTQISAGAVSSAQQRIQESANHSTLSQSVNSSVEPSTTTLALVENQSNIESAGEGIPQHSQRVSEDLVAPEQVLKQEIVAPEATFSMTSSETESQQKDLKQRVAEHLAAGQQPQAMVLLTQLLRDEPDNINVRKKLSSLHFAQGHHTQAKLILTEGVELFPQRADFRLMLARILVLQQRQAQAMQWLTDVPASHIDEELLAYRAALAQQLKQTQVAKQDYSALTRLNPSNAKWWLGLGIAEDQLGNPQKALFAYQSAKQTNELNMTVADFVKTRIDILSESK